MENELENSEKKERRKQPKPAQSATARTRASAPAPSDRRTPPVSGSSPSRAPSLSCSLPSEADLSVPVFFLARSLSLSVSRARIASRRAVAPHTPFSSLCAVDPTCQFRPLHARRGPARAHSRTSPDFSATTPAHAPSSHLRAPPVPRAHPSPHFAQLHPLSRSAHATSRRRRPTPAFPAIQLAGDRSKPPQAPPRGETPVPVPNFPYCALCLANFAFVGARPRRSAVLARWPANLARSSSPE
jgi:hypothetical protein